MASPCGWNTHVHNNKNGNKWIKHNDMNHKSVASFEIVNKQLKRSLPSYSNKSEIRRH